MFTGETKYGYADGQQIGWWGTTFPVFARVVNGTAYCVGREMTPGAADLNRVYKLGRDWLTNFFGQVTANGAGDAALFVDGPHFTLETADGSEYIPTLDLPVGTAKVVTRPTGGPASPVVPVTPPVLPVTPPATPGTPVPGPATPSPDIMTPLTNPTPGPATLDTAKTMPAWMLYGLVGLCGLVIGLVVLLVVRK